MNRSITARPKAVQAARKTKGMVFRRRLRLELEVNELCWFMVHADQGCSDRHCYEHPGDCQPDGVRPPLQIYQRRREALPLSPVGGRIVSAHELMLIWHERNNQRSQSDNNQCREPDE